VGRGPAAAAIIVALVGMGIFTWLVHAGKLTPAAYLGGLALVAASALYLAGPPAWCRSSAQQPNVDPRTTGRIIAFALIGVYGTSLLGTMVIAAYSGVQADNAWLDVFKSGFLLLGGGLTSIIGYYFGARVNPVRNQDSTNPDEGAGDGGADAEDGDPAATPGQKQDPQNLPAPRPTAVRRRAARTARQAGGIPPPTPVSDLPGEPDDQPDQQSDDQPGEPPGGTPNP
jgi:hypothetical protein